MDANMYIPLPEELEWLEANSHLHQDLEDYEDQEPPEPYPEEEEEHLPEPPSPLSQPQVNGQKRPLSDGPDAPILESVAKLICLRPELRKYGCEIDGDCIPVTGPGGDRVYLKISATGSDGRLKKLDLEGRTKGESSFVVAVWLPREWRKRTVNAIYEF
ncbi:hypothetical protein CK203_055384 [Vitis vinifera]|uniref:Uncharacterized protein n=1 Tax=Vitis vinifera TaxID=29760 RepID=A0A438HMW6_VITVI|nr:hypothetical protein CK203_055384 [Vitis vinifera]